MSSPSLLNILWDTEWVLRRQLQAVTDDTDTSMTTTDPNNLDYTTTTQPNTNEESSQSRGRTVLTILYLCVLGLCFVVPVFYYFRLHCFEEHARRELELDFTTALEQSTQHREESRAARRKYIEERRARIVQLLLPVRMILKQENFPHLNDPNAPPRTGSFLNLDFESEKFHGIKSDNESATMTSEDVFSPYTSDDDEEGVHPNDSKQDDDEEQVKKHNKPQQQGVIETKCEYEKDDDEQPQSAEERIQSKKKDPQHNPYGDEDTFFVRIPVPGLPLGGSCLLDPMRPQRLDNNHNGDRETRLTPGLCTICLSNYKVGSDIVWSSNEACDHHFHFNCIEKWLMKQREGPLCPCCRRDFIVDPLDLLEEEEHNNNDNNNETDNDNNNASPPMFSWDPATLDDDDAEFGPIIVSAPGGGAGNFSSYDDPTRLEEGLNPPAAQEEENPATSESSTEESDVPPTERPNATRREGIEDPGSAVQV